MRDTERWAARETVARRVRCPDCRARAREVCTEPDGNPPPESHQARYELAVEVNGPTVQRGKFVRPRAMRDVWSDRL